MPWLLLPDLSLFWKRAFSVPDAVETRLVPRSPCPCKARRGGLPETWHRDMTFSVRSSFVRWIDVNSVVTVIVPIVPALSDKS